jgi:hypothetical protein
MHIDALIVAHAGDWCKLKLHDPAILLRVSLNAEETVTVFPALFFYPKAGERRLKH